MFKIEKPSSDQLAFFYKNGYLVFPDVLTNEGREGLIKEILETPEVVDFLSLTNEERGRSHKPHRLSLIQWKDQGKYGDQLFDAPLVVSLLSSIIGEIYHFCHASIRISMRGSQGLGFHHDNLPLNQIDRNKWYIQMIYYPTGFEKGDASLWVIPGSHQIIDLKELAPIGPAIEEASAELLMKHYHNQVDRELKAEELSLPIGSLVVMDARLWHAVSPKPLDSPQEMRLFLNYIFKEEGEPHPYTQAISESWFCNKPSRSKIFQRSASSWSSSSFESEYGSLK